MRYVESINEALLRLRLAATFALGEDLSSHRAALAGDDGDGLHRGGVGQGDSPAVGGACRGRSGDVRGVVD